MAYPAAYPNWVFSMFAFIGFLCCAIPFPWHLEAWNTGTCLYMFWTGLGCLFQFVNSIVWNRNAINWAPVWCDITARFIVGCSWAIPAASLCINRRLYHIASVRSVTISRAEKRRAIMVDLAIGLGLPILGMILQYIPQGHRFNIFEDVGCYPFTYNTPVAFALVWCPPVAIGLVSGVYCVLSIRNFWKRHNQFSELLSNHSNLTSNRYIRLMALAATDVLLTVPLGSWAISLNVSMGIHPWLGWEDTHRGFSRVDQFPAILWRSDKITEICIEFTRWNIVVCALVFFAFFGFADEARKHYKSAVSTVAKKMGYSTFSSTGSGTGIFASTGSRSQATDSMGKIRPIPPIHVHSDMLQRHRSIDSFTNVSVTDTPIDEKEKGFSPTASYGAFTLSDVGGTLADYSPSTGSSASSISSPEQPRSPSRLSNNDQPTTLAVPEPARHQSDRSAV
ncbi:pheromone B alpha 1 receptor [Coprinopsis cinerea okayama7|uniref:Pheromone B alpha 1 receptor n=1 Tax=Coprinopsis cinerea (strain Okayama-7 / 130 / ATCC MYA-4618 / FGSC 9003) TaxID=240176 RepID=A8NKD2_COPC7|nr:pheromone B alpha 1 receptor [Coprinopsis cinerea okayama7\|eukprot:XP_001834415.2 pheromone B alpha 1 receptor [Coprinopsis cinerea okayama7\